MLISTHAHDSGGMGQGGPRGGAQVSPPIPRPKNCCWNCQGDHMIGDCPDPKDHRRITKNRNAFMAAKNRRNELAGGGMNMMGGRSKRYHEEQSSVKPGMLSEGLRYAMELGPQEVPSHVYRMRLYGYPPGIFFVLILLKC